MFAKRRLRSVHAQILQGKVHPLGGLEVIATDHCNVACRQCNHGSPILRKWNADPDEVARHAAILADVFNPRFIKVLGGEPLLHPRLAELISKVRNTGISDHYILVTNGILLERMDPEVWTLIDELELSHYPGANLKPDFIDRIQSLTVEHDVKFTRNIFNDFRRTFSSKTSRDNELVSQIFSACKIAHVWGCHALYNGRLYRCPQSIYVPFLTGRNIEEGIPVTARPELRNDILSLLNSDEPLESCKNCVGTSGIKQPHSLLARKDWRDDLELPLEECLNRSLLEENQKLLKVLDDCKVNEAHANPGFLKQFIERLGRVPSRFRNSTYRRKED